MLNLFKKIEIALNDSEKRIFDSMFADVKNLNNKGYFRVYHLIFMVLSKKENINLQTKSILLLAKMKSNFLIRFAIRRGIKSQSSLLRKDSAYACLYLADDKMAKSLSNLLFDSNYEVKYNATLALTVCSDEKAVSNLIKIVNNKNEMEELRDCAIQALAFSENKRSVETIIDQLHDSSGKIRYSAVFYLGELLDKKALPALREIVESNDQFIGSWGTVSEEAERSIEMIERQTVIRNFSESN